MRTRRQADPDVQTYEKGVKTQTRQVGNSVVYTNLNTKGRGKDIKEYVKRLRCTIDNFDPEGNEILKAKQNEEKEAKKQLEENIGGGGTEAEDDETEDEDDRVEEETEVGSGKKSEEWIERTDSGNDQCYQEDVSLATDDSEEKNSSAEARDQTQANITQILEPKKHGRRLPGQSSRSNGGGIVEVKRSGMSKLALKDKLKSCTKRPKKETEDRRWARDRAGCWARGWARWGKRDRGMSWTLDIAMR